MPVDLTLSDASLLKRQFKTDGFRILAQEFSPEDYGYIRAMGYMELYGISIKHVPESRDNLPANHCWHILQMDYFKFIDLITLLIMSVEYNDTILPSDARPFRLKLAATVEATSEFLRIQAYYGITDDNAYIDNHYNDMCFTTDGIKRVINILEDRLEGVYENIGA